MTFDPFYETSAVYVVLTLIPLVGGSFLYMCLRHAFESDDPEE